MTDRFVKSWVNGLPDWGRKMGLKLDLGCGLNKRTGFLGVDSDPSFKPDIVCDIAKNSPAPANSVEYVYCSHMFEHLSEDEQCILIRSILNMCQVGATVEIKVPLHLPDPSHKVILGYEWVSFLSRSLLPWLVLYEYKIDSITTNSILPHDNGRQFTYEQATAIFKMKTREGLGE